jgi:transcriptional regulator
MYIRPTQLPLERSDIVDLIKSNMFATLLSHSSAGMVATQLPFLFDENAGPEGTLIAHLAKANPQAALLSSGTEVLVIFEGPHGYISPRWYPKRARAPSWNYTTAHCYGIPRMIPPSQTLDVVERLVTWMEQGQSKPWSTKELGETEVARLISLVVAFEIPLTRVEAKFKLGQGEDPKNIEAAVAAVDASGNRDLAAMMRKYNPSIAQTCR